MLNDNKDTVKKVSKITFGWSVASTVRVVIGKASKGILRAGTSQPSILRCARRDEGGSSQRGSGGE